MICGRFASHSDYRIQSASEPNVTCSASCSIAQGNEYAVQMGFLIQLTLKGKRTPCLCGRCLHLMNFYYFNDLLRPHGRQRTNTQFLLLSMMLGLRGFGRSFVAVSHCNTYNNNCCEWLIPWANQSTWKWWKFMENDLILFEFVHVAASRGPYSHFTWIRNDKKSLDYIDQLNRVWLRQPNDSKNHHFCFCFQSFHGMRMGQWGHFYLFYDRNNKLKSVIKFNAIPLLAMSQRNNAIDFDFVFGCFFFFALVSIGHPLNDVENM